MSGGICYGSSGNGFSLGNILNWLNYLLLYNGSSGIWSKRSILAWIILGSRHVGRCLDLLYRLTNSFSFNFFGLNNRLLHSFYLGFNNGFFYSFYFSFNNRLLGISIGWITGISCGLCICIIGIRISNWLLCYCFVFNRLLYSFIFRHILCRLYIRSHITSQTSLIFCIDITIRRRIIIYLNLFSIFFVDPLTIL